MVKFISSEQVLPLRSAQLRGGQPLEACVFATDALPGAFHLGCFAGQELVSVASFFPQMLKGAEEAAPRAGESAAPCVGDDIPPGAAEGVAQNLTEGAAQNSVETAYQLRGMATAAGHGGQGYGTELLKFAIEQLKVTDATYLWCNAREAAVPFYEKNGFNKMSPKFEIAGIGPHYEMLKKLR